MFIDQCRYADYTATYPSYYPTMIIYYKPIVSNGCINGLDVVLQKTRELYSYKELIGHLVVGICGEVDGELLGSVLGMIGNDGGNNNNNVITINQNQNINQNQGMNFNMNINLSHNLNAQNQNQNQVQNQNMITLNSKCK